MAHIFNAPWFDSFTELNEKAFANAKNFWQAVQAREPELAAEFAEAIHAAKDNKPAFLDIVAKIVPKSSLVSDVDLSHHSADPRFTQIGQAKMKNLAMTFPWFHARDQSLATIASFTSSVATPQQILDTVPGMIKDFTFSITNHNVISPFEALVFIVVLKSFGIKGSSIEFHPQLLLWLCNAILSRASAASVYAAMNWAIILPHNQFLDLLRGVRPPIDVDNRAADIGAAVNRIKSFPLMPDNWGMAQWNSMQLNAALAAADAPTAAAGAASDANPPPLPMLDIYSSPTGQPSTTIHGLDNLNEALKAIGAAGGKSVKLSINNGALDLRPLAHVLHALLREPTNSPTVNPKRTNNANKLAGV